VHWGLDDPSIGEETWAALKAAYDAVDAIDWTDLTPEPAKVGVLCYPCFSVGAERNSGYRFAWEMAIRANIPCEAIIGADCTDANLAQYDALLVPRLNTATLATLSTTAQAALQTFAATKPVLCECADGSEYGGGAQPTIPAWATPLLSSRAHVTPPSWYPSFHESRGYEYDAGVHYNARMAALVADYRAKTGCTAISTTLDHIVRRYRRGSTGCWVVFTVHAATGEYEWDEITPATVTTSATTVTTGVTAVGLEATIWHDEPPGLIYRFDEDFQFDVGKQWDGEDTIWYDEEDT